MFFVKWRHSVSGDSLQKRLEKESDLCPVLVANENRNGTVAKIHHSRLTSMRFISLCKRHRFVGKPNQHHAPWCNLFNPTLKPSLYSPLISHPVCQEFHCLSRGTTCHQVVMLIKPNSREIIRTPSERAPWALHDKRTTST